MLTDFLWHSGENGRINRIRKIGNVEILFRAPMIFFQQCELDRKREVQNMYNLTVTSLLWKIHLINGICKI